jgi:hypothetical protein
MIDAIMAGERATGVHELVQLAASVISAVSLSTLAWMIGISSLTVQPDTWKLRT